MSELLIRCSSLGKIMTEPRSKSEGPLSVGAKTYLRELAAQDILGVDFEVSSKEMRKGLMVEQEAIDLLNRVRGTALAKNTERRSNEWITGECDLFDEADAMGHDIKAAWSAKTFPISEADCGGTQRALYEWQCIGYAWLWNANYWSVDYCLVDTPQELIGYEPLPMHIVSVIPENLRVTSWRIRRSHGGEQQIRTKVSAARDYYAEIVAEFDRTHRP